MQSGSYTAALLSGKYFGQWPRKARCHCSRNDARVQRAGIWALSPNSYGIQYILNIVCIAPEGRPYAFNLQHPDEKGVKDTGWQSQEPGRSPGAWRRPWELAQGTCKNVRVKVSTERSRGTKQCVYLTFVTIQKRAFRYRGVHILINLLFNLLFNLAFNKLV